MSCADEGHHSQDLLGAALSQSGLTVINSNGPSHSTEVNLPDLKRKSSYNEFPLSLTTDGTKSIKLDHTPPAQVFKTSSSVSSKKQLIATSTTSATSSASDLLPQSQNSPVSTPARRNLYARVTVSGRKFLVPVLGGRAANKQLLVPAVKEHVKPVENVVSAASGPPVLITNQASPVHKEVPKFTLAEVPLDTAIHKENPQQFNLGSLFVKSAENETDVFSTVLKAPKANDALPMTTDCFESVKAYRQNAYYKRCHSSPMLCEADILSSLTFKRSNLPKRIPDVEFREANSSHKLPEKQDGWKVFESNQSSSEKLQKEIPFSWRPVASPFTKPKRSGSGKDLNALDIKFTSDGAKSCDELIEEGEHEGEGAVMNTYAEYKPSKMNIGLPHPDRVVETNSLSSIPLPNICYKTSIPEETIATGALSALQLETIAYACQKHLTFIPNGERSGFLIGDGAGVGKGRTIAGIIFENYLLGRKRALWFSVSNDLKYDSERDLRDIGAKNIQVYALNKFKYGKISSRENNSVKKGVIFATYSSLISESHAGSKYRTRLKQILHWCGKDFDGVVVFDECHKAKNLVPTGSTKPTKTSHAVLELQKQLSNARIIYASATGASEPRNMAYMSRIGLWGKGTPFIDFMDFIQAVEKRGVGAMELVAMDLKSRGTYIARQLSFHGVSFSIDEVKLSPQFIAMYNEAVKLWVAARDAFQVGADLIDAEHHMKKAMWSQFWAAHQRFFKYLCIASKVDHASQLAREAVKHGKCVVIGLQSTGEARTLDQLNKSGGELNDFVSTARGVFESLIEHHFPAPDRERVTDLFGKNFYKRDAQDVNVTVPVMPNKASNKKPSEKSTEGSSESESDPMSDVSVEYSDEDIGKIFGDNDSDSEEWGIDAKRAKKRPNLNNSETPGVKDVDKQVERDNYSSTSNRTSLQPKDPSTTSLKQENSFSANFNLPEKDPVTKAQFLKQELLWKLYSINLPSNTLDELIESLGGTENVAEMTGRKGRVVISKHGNVQYECRAENDVRFNMLNLAEKQRFMDGEKNIAIISEAASSGISLQSDRRARNQRRRLHITLELPWSADRAIQQFGRTHRSNQVSAPEYVFIISELAGERRFASIVAKRLESLGALTQGDRRATKSRDLSQFNFDNKYGRAALEYVMKSIAGLIPPVVPIPTTYNGLFIRDMRHALTSVGLISAEPSMTSVLEKEYGDIGKFLNRILGMEVLQQNAIFQYFLDTLSAIVKKAKSEGQYDQGIMDVGSEENLVERVDCHRYQLTDSRMAYEADSGSNADSTYVELHTVKVERGISWEKAEQIWSQACASEYEGFYITHLKRNSNHMAVLCIAKSKESISGTDAKVPDEDRLYALYRPNTGKHVKKEMLSSIRSRYRRVQPDEAKKWWIKQYKASLDVCSHTYWQGVCNRQCHGDVCDFGKRQHTYRILSGHVLAIWKMVEHVLSSAIPTIYKMRIVRFEINSGIKLVGLLIPATCISALNSLLHSLATTQETSNHHDWTQLENRTRFAEFPTSSTLGDASDEDSGSGEDILNDNFSPDEVLSSVLVPRKNYSWMS